MDSAISTTARKIENQPCRNVDILLVPIALLCEFALRDVPVHSASPRNAIPVITAIVMMVVEEVMITEG